MLARLRRSPVPCYLAVLKDFGPASWAPLRSRSPGWTLALDLPRVAPGLEPLLRRFDELVAGAGGRVYLSKDSRLRPDLLRGDVPRLGTWRAVRDARRPRARSGALTWGFAPASCRGRAMSAAPRRPPGASWSAAPPRSAWRSCVGWRADGPVEPVLIGRDRDRPAGGGRRLESAGASPAEIELDRRRRHRRPRGCSVASAFASPAGVDAVILAVGVLGAQAGLDADPDEAPRSCGSTSSGPARCCCMSAPAARPGSRHVDRALECRRRASAGRQRDLRRGQGGTRRARPGARRRHRRYRRAGAHCPPGFVSTRMTAGLEPAPLSTSAEAVAQATVRAMTGSHPVWVPGRLRWLFAVLRHLPRAAVSEAAAVTVDACWNRPCDRGGDRRSSS